MTAVATARTTVVPAAAVTAALTARTTVAPAALVTVVPDVSTTALEGDRVVPRTTTVAVALG